jgi:hypothetical protein
MHLSNFEQPAHSGIEDIRGWQTYGLLPHLKSGADVAGFQVAWSLTA